MSLQHAGAEGDVRIPGSIGATLVSPADYAADAIHDAYTWLRKNNPLGVAEPAGFDPFWVVTKHADILSISRDNKLFPSAVRSTTLTDQASAKRAYEISGSPNLVRSLVQMDEPDHLKYRSLSQSWFMPANIKKREEAIRELARASCDGMAGRNGACDFVPDVALNYPLQVVMNILGVPPEDFPRMLRLTQELFGVQDPDTRRALAAMSAGEYAAVLQTVVDEFAAYFDKISASRRAAPKDDLATLIANAQIDGVPIPVREATGYYIIVATAGHDTTSSSTAGAMQALCQVPGLLARLQADPSLIPAFVEEAIRWTTPVKTFMRSASADAEIRGRKIAKGDWLMLCYASGNRDEEVFEDPFRFNIDRTPNKQLAFGYGAHLCLGQHLARMEIRIFFEQLLPRLRSVELAGAPKYVESWFVNGLKNLPIRYVMD